MTTDQYVCINCEKIHKNAGQIFCCDDCRAEYRLGKNGVFKFISTPHATGKWCQVK